MNALRSIVITLLAAALCWLAVGAEPAEPAAPSIQGSYVLDFRELPDGTKVRSPEVIGMMTLTKDHRNFNVYWTDNGKPVSISTISTYSLSATEFTEESLYYADNGVAGKGPNYETKPVSGKAPVTVNGDKIEFQLPLHGEPKVVFDKNGLTATRAGAFVDHWKKVE
ncbi:MAG TPA: hypothetical protein VIL86_17805 [Tepidisphaeraceae bacterium]|jgi:hypothetical protein